MARRFLRECAFDGGIICKHDKEMPLKELEKIIEDLKKELCKKYPFLAGNQSAIIEIKTFSKTDGLYFTAYLVEVPQFSLPFAFKGSSGIESVEGNSYIQLIKAINLFKSQLQSQSILNHSANYHKQMLIDGGVREIMVSTSRTSRLFDSRQFDLGFGNVLDISKELVVTACVKNLNRHEADLFKVSVCGSLEHKIPTKIRLRRVRGVNYQENGYQLLEAMDSGISLTLKVCLVFSRCNDGVDALELVEIMDEFKRNEC